MLNTLQETYQLVSWILPEATADDNGNNGGPELVDVADNQAIKHQP